MALSLDTSKGFGTMKTQFIFRTEEVCAEAATQQRRVKHAKKIHFEIAI